MADIHLYRELIQSGIDGDRAGRQEGGMRRQRRSFTDIICENC
ncbi:NinE family protein, partial [Escherichia coli]|nr:NinE family protein [Escherichia coli]